MLSRVAIDDKTNDGVYLTGTKPPVFRRIVPPSSTDLQTSNLTLDPADDSYGLAHAQ